MNLTAIETSKPKGRGRGGCNEVKGSLNLFTACIFPSIVVTGSNVTILEKLVAAEVIFRSRKIWSGEASEESSN